MEIVLKNLPDIHKDAIRKIGFGGFLELDMANHNSTLAEKLVMSFDVDRNSLILPNNQELFIGPEDIHLVYGLPLGGIKIEEPEEEVDEEWIEFLKKWRDLFNLKKGSPTNKTLIPKIEELKKKDVCEEFIWNFVLSVVNCCMRSTINNQIYIKILV